MKSYSLFLDDYRNPPDCLSHKNDERYSTLEWVVVRNHEEFVKTLEEKWKQGATPSLVSFDHDLYPEHYHPSMFQGVNAYELAYRDFSRPTGRRSAAFLVQFCQEKSLPLPECLIHTMNPAGKERIARTLGISLEEKPPAGEGELGYE